MLVYTRVISFPIVARTRRRLLYLTVHCCYLVEAMVVHHTILAVQQRPEGVLRVQQHLALAVL